MAFEIWLEDKTGVVRREVIESVLVVRLAILKYQLARAKGP